MWNKEKLQRKRRSGKRYGLIRLRGKISLCREETEDEVQKATDDMTEILPAD